MSVDGQRFMTKTQHYRKVTKPLLERKRRARMNLYLDELKDLIVDTMEAQGEHVTKLEKADILEMTVNYLKTHKHEVARTIRKDTDIVSGNSVNYEKFRAGYTQAAVEVSKIFNTLPGLDVKFGTRLMKHLGYQLKDIQPSIKKCNETKEVEFIKPKDYPVRRKSAENIQHGLKIQNLQAKPGEDVWRPW
ncbi:enhancer of split mdelta protein [Teleopsis dalmanni]|uniref:Enhancer of split region protein HLHmd n=1 Tax=Teleopsis dalmanni TaxID=139649 RepID=G9I1L1_TELDL|nr:enhancer of split mdelta protein [Teleopsis dalmanni]AEV91198.1 enhancer of split region protein HLHmd [Teleopsis dalmanni]